VICRPHTMNLVELLPQAIPNGEFAHLQRLPLSCQSGYMAPSLTEDLIDICTRPVGEAAQNRCAWALLDWCGCAFIGSTAPAGRALAALTGQRNLTGRRCFAVGASAQDAGGAAFLNGGLGNIYEMDDVHRTSILHAGDVVIPAALAVAQERRISGPDLLKAIAAGYEAALRIGIAAAANGYSAWYNSGTCGVFGAALAAGRVLDLDKPRLADALGQAGMMASGIWQCRLEPTYSKQLATAHAARSGVLAAQLAATGFPGALHILEGELGFFKTYYPASDPNLVTRDPEADWQIFDVSFKPWPACRHAHPAIEAALNLRAMHVDRSISKITVSTYAAAIDFCDNPRPVSDHEARFSLQHCVATAFLKGAPELNDFGETARTRSDLAVLMDKVELHSDDGFTEQFPGYMGARIEIQMADGTSDNSTVATAKGDPENPMSHAELSGKFHKLANAAGISHQSAKALEEAVHALPQEPNLTRLDVALEQIATELNAQS